MHVKCDPHACQPPGGGGARSRVEGNGLGGKTAACGARRLPCTHVKYVSHILWVTGYSRQGGCVGVNPRHLAHAVTALPADEMIQASQD